MAEYSFKSRWHSLLYLPALAGFILFFWASLHTDLSKREAREGVPVTRMLDNKDRLIPRIDENTIRTKSPAWHWFAWAASEISGGASETALRFPSVLAGAGTVALTTWFGLRLFSPFIGVLSGLLLMLSWRMIYLSSHARIDMLFAFFTTASLALLWKLWHEDDLKVRSRIVVFACMSLSCAVMAKGPLGLLFPLMALAGFLKLTGWKAVPWKTLIGVPLSAAGLWAGIAIWQGGPDVQQMLYQEIVGRLTNSKSIQVHHEPFYYYIHKLIGDLAPWSFFLPSALWYGWKYKRKESPWLFPAAAFTSLFVFLSVLSGKRGDYLLPLYPFAMIILSVFFSEGMNRISDLFWKVPAGMLGLCMAIFSLAFALPLFVPELDANAHFGFLSAKDRWSMSVLLENHLPGAGFLSFFSLLMIAFSVLCWMSIKKKQGRRVVAVIGAWFLIAVSLIVGPVAQAIDEQASLRPFANKILQLAGDRPLYHYGEPRENLLYYLGRTLPVLYDGQLSTELKKPSHPMLVGKNTVRKHIMKLEPELEVIFDTKHPFKGYSLMSPKF